MDHGDFVERAESLVDTTHVHAGGRVRGLAKQNGRFRRECLRFGCPYSREKSEERRVRVRDWPLTLIDLSAGKCVSVS